MHTLGYIIDVFSCVIAFFSLLSIGFTMVAEYRYNKNQYARSIDILAGVRRMFHYKMTIIALIASSVWLILRYLP